MNYSSDEGGEPFFRFRDEDEMSKLGVSNAISNLPNAKPLISKNSKNSKNSKSSDDKIDNKIRTLFSAKDAEEKDANLVKLQEEAERQYEQSFFEDAPVRNKHKTISSKGTWRTNVGNSTKNISTKLTKSSAVGDSIQSNTNSIVRKTVIDAKHTTNKAMNTFETGNRLRLAKNVRHTGRDDRATTEQVMDPRTRLILFNLINSKCFQQLHGCISTGKEANVYHATDDMAVKVFKTSILVFKDRDKYVKGDNRYKGGYCRKNPRKMVKMWAEKEMRNLKRIHSAGIPSPKPIRLRDHVLVMTFLGKNGWASPRLKDAALSESALRRCYQSVVKIMRRMYQVCGLVHADLSEYNVCFIYFFFSIFLKYFSKIHMLYHNKEPFIIDVSQSVEGEHPRAFDFLRMDCKNVTDFFLRKKMNNLMSIRQLFDFIIDERFGCDDDELDQHLESIQLEIQTQNINIQKGDIIEETIENEIQNAQDEDFAAFKAKMLGMSLASSSSNSNDTLYNNDSEDDNSIENPNPNDTLYNNDSEDDKIKTNIVNLNFMCKNASKEERKRHKKAVKDAKANKRKDKIKKSVKARFRKIAKSKGKK
eukprot:GSMAST32.ASY1.ANO1.1829.1 assembled CDS